MRLLLRVTINNAGEEELTRDEMLKVFDEEGGIYQVAVGWSDLETWELVEMMGNFKESTDAKENV